jgi:hypothetical protein
MSGPDPAKVYIAADSFWITIEGHDVMIAKGSPRMGDDPAVIRVFPKLWIEADLDPEIRARRRLAEVLRVAEPSATTEEPSARGLKLSEILAAYRQQREERDRRPTRLEVATALHTSEATLKRAQKELGKAAWPPF